MASKAGWAEVDITPPLGLPMGGRGPRYAPGTHVLDPLIAQALMLEDATGNQTLWISLDLIGFSYARSADLRYALAAITGIPYDAIVLNFAHTHSGPMVNFEKYPGGNEEPADLLAYHEDLRSKILHVAQEAVSGVNPVIITLHQGISDLGINRRRRLETGAIALAPNPEGAYNSDLWVLDITTIDSDDRCILFNIGCHPVIVYSYAWQGISADYPGACRRALKDHFGATTHCQFFQGLAGNVRPRILADYTTGTFRKSIAGNHITAGEALAQAVVQAISNPGAVLPLALCSRTGWVQARKDMQKILPLPEWQAMAESEDELTRNVGQYWAHRIIHGPQLAQVSPMEVGMLRLDSRHAIAWLSAEAVAEWMPLIRACNPALNITIWGYSQFVPTYLPTDVLLSEGGYEVVNANMYEVNGPGQFASGLDESFSRVFRDLLG